MAPTLPLSLRPSVDSKPRRWWIPAGAILLALIYLPTLSTRFDFIDDGNLVYPTRPMPLDQRATVVWRKIVANYEDLGPFRPVLWVHWETAADLLQGSELGWRTLRLCWCALAALMLLWLMAELRIAPLAALVAGAVAMWNPYRNEIWTSLSLAEGVAMPYALLALICPCRAVRGRRPWIWDLLGVCCVLAALGCKNTFAALIPAQMFLRLAPDLLPLRDGWRQHGRRALLLSLTLIMPVVHMIYFKLHWHPGQYTTDGASLAQLRRIASGLMGALSLDFVGLGLALALLAQLVGWARSERRTWLTSLAGSHRAALGAGVLLLLGGVVLYLPIGAVSGRYAMPAVWGLDLAVGVLLTGLLALRPTHWTRTAWAAWGLGLVCVMVASVGKQQKFAARARLLWDALDYVARDAPANARVAWMAGNPEAGALDQNEGVHFQWHLSQHGRPDVRVILYEHGQPLVRPELAGAAQDDEPTLALWGPPQAGAWPVVQHFAAAAWGGARRYDCYLGQRPVDGAHAALTSPP